MDMELVSGIAAVATAVLGWFGKKWKDEWEEKQIAKRSQTESLPAPGKNGKYVTPEHCQAQMQIIEQRFDTVIEKQDEQHSAVQKLTETIFEWKDNAIEKLADHGARLNALERQAAHGARG